MKGICVVDSGTKPLLTNFLRVNFATITGSTAKCGKNRVASRFAKLSRGEVILFRLSEKRRMSPPSETALRWGLGTPTWYVGQRDEKNAGSLLG